MKGKKRIKQLEKRIGKLEKRIKALEKAHGWGLKSRPPWWDEDERVIGGCVTQEGKMIRSMHL